MWSNIKDTIRRVQRFASTPFRMVVILTAILLMIGWLMAYLRLLDALLGVELLARVQIPGIVAVVAGGALGLTCGAMLSTRGIGTLGGEEWFMPREFVATGPFRFVRNPMSLGGVVMLTGIALWHPLGLRSWVRRGHVPGFPSDCGPRGGARA
jgi:protein-S-isoprenylcysteine O-methyltransferase Ste14